MTDPTPIPTVTFPMKILTLTECNQVLTIRKQMFNKIQAFIMEASAKTSNYNTTFKANLNTELLPITDQLARINTELTELHTKLTSLSEELPKIDPLTDVDQCSSVLRKSMQIMNQSISSVSKSMAAVENTALTIENGEMSIRQTTDSYFEREKIETLIDELHTLYSSMPRTFVDPENAGFDVKSEVDAFGAFVEEDKQRTFVARDLHYQLFSVYDHLQLKPREFFLLNKLASLIQVITVPDAYITVASNAKALDYASKYIVGKFM